MCAGTSSPEYKGYKIDWAATGVPRTSQFGGGSFKAEFQLVGKVCFRLCEAKNEKRRRGFGPVLRHLLLRTIRASP